ncbi:MAG: type II toxin-antitoxin system VapC family toxin [Phycisphaerae bacterium]|nr:type II toxin-antitoxin system VapC family toxin [Phycisphaerae bacterium]
MTALIDTHALLWFVMDDPRLGAEARRCMRSGDNELLLSIGSCWELAVKCALGKISIEKPFGQFLWPQLRDNDIRLLPIAEEHLNLLAGLEQHHRDPFDRLLVAQALAERIPLISGDAALDAYGVLRMW